MHTHNFKYVNWTFLELLVEGECVYYNIANTYICNFLSHTSYTPHNFVQIYELHFLIFISAYDEPEYR